MAFCTSCGSQMPDASAFCARCGKSMVDLSQLTTRSASAPTQQEDPSLATTRDAGAGKATQVDITSAPTALSSSGARNSAGSGLPRTGAGGIQRPAPPIDSGGTDPASEERFLPGTVVDGRYRIIGLLGRGGMGEVYRADDLKLGQQVALKFLPADMATAADRLARFMNEVRTALKVTHPSVCRVYDIGEVEGHHYLSMEYVDGEDLKSLLRRVGRLPEDRALEIARQICAGLAAAHDQGILHRDLKPANIMVDGRGRARITDFGLAGLAAGIHGTDIRSGTPGYMAPEQLAGREVTVRSDVYALGLVLYELFTGKRAFDARSATEMMRLQSQSSPATPTSLVQGLDPAVERVVLQCLENDPAVRPSSALAVSAALPGGDPLAAALAAGETPSPELVAASGSKEGLPLWRVNLLVLAAVMGLILMLTSGRQVDIAQLVQPPLEPSVLVNKSREILTSLGHDEVPADSSYGFSIDAATVRELSREANGDQRQERLASGYPAMVFWYRQARQPLLPLNRDSMFARAEDPPVTRPGMARMGLDVRGRLLYLGIVPEATEESSPGREEPDWQNLLKAAGYDPAALKRVVPLWTPNLQTDQRAAWEGVHPDFPEWTMRLEAGAFNGQPNYLRVIHPWNEPPAPMPIRAGPARRAGEMVNVAMFLAVLVMGAVLARRNQLQGRGDHRGAFRLALAVLGFRLLVWVLAGHHVLGGSEMRLFTGNLAAAAYMAMLVWVLYLALEPYFRQLWPRQMISWVRLLGGRWRDPLVGRDVLVGILLGIFIAICLDLYHLLPQWLGLPLPLLDVYSYAEVQMVSLRSPRHALAMLVSAALSALYDGFVVITFLVLLSLLAKRLLGTFTRPWVWRGGAVVVWLLCIVVTIGQGGGSVWLHWLNGLVILSVLALVLVRYGFLSALMGIAVLRATSALSLTLNLDAWWAKGSILLLLVLAATVTWGMVSAMGLRAAAPARS